MRYRILAAGMISALAGSLAAQAERRRLREIPVGFQRLHVT